MRNEDGTDTIDVSQGAATAQVHPDGKREAPPAVEPPAPRGRRRRWVLAIGAVAALTGMAAAGYLVGHATSTTRVVTNSDRVGVQQWWRQAQPDVEGLQDTIQQARSAIAEGNARALFLVCQTMHDASALRLRAHLPAPEPTLNADVQGAVDDAHLASHVCLAAQAGSENETAGEFTSDMEAADRQLRSAQDLVNGMLVAN